MMYVHTPKRPSLPPTPSSYSGKPTSLPPLSSILNMSKDQFGSTPFSVPSKYYNQPQSHPSAPHNSSTYLPRLPSIDFTTPSKFQSSAYQKPLATPSRADTSDPDISITDMRRAATAPSSVATSRASSVAGGSTPVLAAPAAAVVKDSKSFAFISHSPATFPSQEPAIDNAPLARRKRRRTSPNELSILNTEFELGSTPNKLRRIEIASKVSMTEKAVQIWFQNKRQSLRKQSNHEKEITELPPTPPIIILQQRQTMPLPLVSSTPTKPLFHKSHSFMGSPSVTIPPASTSSPIKERSRSIPLFNRTEDADTSLEDSMVADNSTGLVLNETRKKQPVLLNSNNTSTMTFKLTPSSSQVSLSSANKLTQKLTVAADESTTNYNKENANRSTFSIAPIKERKPLGAIDANSSKTESTKQAVVENLLSLRAGNWA